MLSEILLLLPPQPSALPRASAVCRSWRSLATDAQFHRRFRLRHRRNPPLLGFFSLEYRLVNGDIFFFPTLEAPNRLPPGRFALHFDNNRFRILGCRHGLVLVLDRNSLQFLVREPLTGEQHRLAFPPWFDFDLAEVPVNGAVLRSAAPGDVHFKVVLLVAVADDDDDDVLLACVYSSQTGVWGNLITTQAPSYYVDSFNTAVLVESSLYWLFGSSAAWNEPWLQILEFDLERQSLAVLQLPVSESELDDDDGSYTVVRAEGGGLGFLFAPYTTANAQLWEMKTNCAGVVSWGLTRAIDLHKLLSLNSNSLVTIRGYAEDNNVLLLDTDFGIFTIELDSLQFKKHPGVGGASYYVPFENVYTTGLVLMLDEGVGRPKDVLEAARADGGLWALHFAAYNEQMEFCRYLIQEMCADVNAADDKGRTPLVFAVLSENAAVVKYLLDHGADPDKADDIGLMPLHYAAGIGDCEMIEMLLAKGAHIDLIADEIGTPLQLATHEQNVGAMKTLLDHNADPNKTYLMYDYGMYAMSPLFQAVNLSSLECVKLLVEAGAVIHSDCVSTASLDSKMGNDGSTECLNFLLEARANNVPTDDHKFKITHLKSFGSQAVKRKDYLSASSSYTQAIDLDPNDATLFSNRNFCWLLMGDGQKALQDALECRKLRPDWLKACYRHGAALMLLEDYGGACQALLDGLKLDPENAEMESELREAMESLKKSKGTRER